MMKTGVLGAWEDEALACEEAARLLSAMEQQPEVEMLRRKALLLERDGFPERAAEVGDHVATLVRLAAERAKVKRVDALRWDLWASPRSNATSRTIATMLDAALAGAGGEREVTR